jgi:hypothetical protein
LTILVGSVASVAFGTGVVWSPSPDIGTGYEGACQGTITFEWSTCTTDEVKYLTADRASGDEDTPEYCSQQADALSSAAPLWDCTVGHFVGDDCGTTVQWQAPTGPGQVTFSLYEDDVPLDMDPEDSGSRDDAITLQDQKVVSVVAE